MKRLIIATALLALAACDPGPAPPVPAPTNVTDEPCVRTADNDCVERWDDGRPK